MIRPWPERWWIGGADGPSLFNLREVLASPRPEAGGMQGGCPPLLGSGAKPRPAEPSCRGAGRGPARAKPDLRCRREAALRAVVSARHGAPIGAVVLPALLLGHGLSNKALFSTIL